MKKFYTIDKEIKKNETKQNRKRGEKNMKSGVHKHESNGEWGGER